jgi:chitinase
MAPETAYVQGGQSAFGGIWGGYLPIIEGLKDSIDILQVQLYNSGSMYGIDGSIYSQGTADFIVAMTEALIQGFNTAGGMFSGLSADKIAVGLPACTSAAGGGFVDTLAVKAAVDYLRGVGIKPGSYSLYNSGGYPSLRGMMTWSVNWDAVSSCGGVYQYANNFQNIFSVTNSIASISSLGVEIFPNPTSGSFTILLPADDATITISDMFGHQVQHTQASTVKTEMQIDNNGIYFIHIRTKKGTVTRKLTVSN